MLAQVAPLSVDRIMTPPLPTATNVVGVDATLATPDQYCPTFAGADHVAPLNLTTRPAAPTMTIDVELAMAMSTRASVHAKPRATGAHCPAPATPPLVVLSTVQSSPTA